MFHNAELRLNKNKNNELETKFKSKANNQKVYLKDQMLKGWLLLGFCVKNELRGEGLFICGKNELKVVLSRGQQAGFGLATQNGQ